MPDLLEHYSSPFTFKTACILSKKNIYMKSCLLRMTDFHTTSIKVILEHTEVTVGSIFTYLLKGVSKYLRVFVSMVTMQQVAIFFFLKKKSFRATQIN